MTSISISSDLLGDDLDETEEKITPRAENQPSAISAEEDDMFRTELRRTSTASATGTNKSGERSTSRR